MTWFAMDLNLEFKNANTLVLDNMIAIGKLNVYSYTVEEVDPKQQQNY